MRWPVVFFLGVLAGCASPPRSGESGLGPDDNPMVYILRAPGFVGFGVKPVVFVNGADVGELSWGSYVRCSVPPGQVRIGTSITTGDSAPAGASSSKDITRLSFTAERGMTYFVQWRRGPEVVRVKAGAEDTSLRFTRQRQAAC